MNITRGKQAKAQKVVIYGPEGVGKSSLAAQFPNALFIDTEGSTGNMDVARLDAPSSWTMIMNQIAWIKANTSVCKTLVIDTIDWAERLCIESVCAQHGKKGIEDFGYGNGYTYVAEEFGRMLNRLQELIDLGINVVLTAHAQIKKFEQPDEMGAYDRYELKLGKKTTGQTAPLVKEWADMILFCNYKTHVVAVDDKGKKHKAQGGTRVMYTEHHPAWDAKNRHNLPFELPLSYDAIAHIFNEVPQQPTVEVPVNQPIESAVTNPTPVEVQVQNVMQQAHVSEVQQPTPQPEQVNNVSPKALQDLMIQNQVTEEEIRLAVSEKKYYTYDTPVEMYDPAFIDGVLIAAWPQVFGLIEENRKLPF